MHWRRSAIRLLYRIWRKLGASVDSDPTLDLRLSPRLGDCQISCVSGRDGHWWLVAMRSRIRGSLLGIRPAPPSSRADVALASRASPLTSQVDSERGGQPRIESADGLVLHGRCHAVVEVEGDRHTRRSVVRSYNVRPTAVNGVRGIG